MLVNLITECQEQKTSPTQSVIEIAYTTDSLWSETLREKKPSIEIMFLLWAHGHSKATRPGT